MAVNVIVVGVTLMMGGFVAVWVCYPRCRAWFEAPKFQPLYLGRARSRFGGMRFRIPGAGQEVGESTVSEAISAATRGCESHVERTTQSVADGVPTRSVGTSGS